jgi:ACS family hexuronate transporter-like MFS transporter
VGEAANWPAALRIVARVLPPEKRSLANGIFNSGASVGAIITPPLVVYLSLRFNWRAAFIAIGALGFLWVVGWFLLTRRVPGLDREQSVPEALYRQQYEAAGLLSTWPEILRSKRFWGLIVASACGNPCYYFYSTWLATYFVQQRGMHFNTELGTVMLLPYLGVGLGSALGGVPVFWLSRRGWSISGARKLTLGCISVVTLSAIAVPHIKTFSIALTIIVLGAAGMGAWIANYISALQDLSPRQVASVAGIIGCFGAFAGALGMWAVGVISSTSYGFRPVFLALGLLPVVASLGVIVPRWPTRVFAPASGR